MIGKVAIFIGALAVAGGAQAQSVNIDIAGKSPRQVRAKLLHAAVQACRSAPASLDEAAADECISTAYDGALSQAKHYWRQTTLQKRIASR